MFVAYSVVSRKVVLVHVWFDCETLFALATQSPNYVNRVTRVSWNSAATSYSQ